MYEFLDAFFTLFFSPLYAMSLDNNLYVVLYVVILVLAVWSFIRRLFQCLLSSIF